MVAFLYFFAMYLVWYSCVWGGGGEKMEMKYKTNFWVRRKRMETIKRKKMVINDKVALIIKKNQTMKVGVGEDEKYGYEDEHGDLWRTMKGRRKVGLGKWRRRKRKWKSRMRRGGAGGLRRRKLREGRMGRRKGTKFSLYITFLISHFFIFSS